MRPLVFTSLFALAAAVAGTSCSSSGGGGGRGEDDGGVDGFAVAHDDGGCSCSASHAGDFAVIACGGTRCVGGTTVACDKSANVTMTDASCVFDAGVVGGDVEDAPADG